MRIYLNLSGRSNKDQISLFSNVQKYLESMGHEIVHDYFSPENFGDFYKPNSEHVKHIFDKANNLISSSDLVVLETSTPSVTIGYQIFQALKMDKNVVCLYTKDNGQLFIEGIEDEKFQLYEYSKSNYKKVLNFAIDGILFDKDVRYNIMLNKSLSEYLNNLSKVKKISKAVYLRQLIEKDMKDNKQ